MRILQSKEYGLVYARIKVSQSMKIHIINYEIGIKSGILTKYADQMVNGLIRLGHEVTVSNKPEKADVNHHINYQSYQSHEGVNTTMVTHLDTAEKLSRMKEVSKEAFGICFSKETMDDLIRYGIPKEKLSVIHPATNVTRRPRIIAIMTQLYPDGRKREEMFAELLKTIDPEKFAFNIVGEGWERTLDALGDGKYSILYQKHYTPEIGQSILNSADYLLYFGKDEGAISVLDAAMAGVKTIAPNVGFHKEIGIDYPFDTQKELNAIFKKLGENPVESWTWAEYVKQHVKIWEKLLS